MASLNKITETLKKVTGQELEINVLSEKRFTFYFEGKNEKAVTKLKSFFKGQLNITGGYDEDGFTCLLGVK